MSTTATHTTSRDRLIDRAIAAWFRSPVPYGGPPDVPNNNLSALEECGGKHYVVLRNRQGIVAVYRVRPNGVLKGLKRWPKELAAQPRAPQGTSQIGAHWRVHPSHQVARFI